MTAVAPVTAASQGGLDDQPLSEVTQAGTSLPRLFGLGPGLLAVALAALGARHRTFWLDEAYTMAATRDLGVAWEAARGSMALYYAFAWAWGQIADSTAWMRLPSIIAMGAAIAVLARMTARQYGLAIGRTAATAAAISFATLRYAQEARSYGLVCLTVALAWSALDRALADGATGPGALRLHRICCAVVPLLHGLAAMQLVAQLGAISMAGLPVTERRRAMVGPLVGLGVLGCLLVVGAGDTGAWLDPLDLAGAWHLIEVLGVPIVGLSAIAAAVAGVQSARLLRRAATTPGGVARFRLLLPVAWGPGAILGILVLSLVRPAQVPRYSISAAFGVVLLVVLAGADWDRARGTRVVPVATIAVATLLGLGGLLALSPEPDPWQRTAEVVADGARPSDVIVFPTEDARLPFEVAWRDAHSTATPALAGSSRPLGTIERSLATPTADELAAAIEGAPRVWVVVQPYAHIPNPDLVDHPDVKADYRTQQVWTEGGDITVTLLVRR